MTDLTPIALKWSTQLSLALLASATSTLPGDKILLPPSALEQLLSAATVITVDDMPPASSAAPSTSTFDPFNPHTYAAERHARAVQSQYAQSSSRQQQLPHPLTFRLVNPENGRVVYAGIREFSSEEGEVVVSPFLRHSLGLDSGGDTKHASEEAGNHPSRITVHAAPLPKGTHVRLRPLEPGYDPEDWKSLLEQHLRTNYTTLTNGEILTIPFSSGSQRGQEFRFLIDKISPEGEAICIVDTDLEVDIEALNEEQARETLKRRLAKSQVVTGSKEGISAGGNLKIGELQSGQVIEGAYVDYQLLNWDRRRALEIMLEVDDEDDEVDLFASPLTPQQRAKPREDEHVFGDMTSQSPKRTILDPSDTTLKGAEEILISVHGYLLPAASSQPALPKRFRLLVSPVSTDREPSDTTSAQTESSDPRCSNCHLPIPPATLALHTVFCVRNNIPCALCHRVFLRNSTDWEGHWHCRSCPDAATAFGSTAASKQKHNLLMHPVSPVACSACPDTTASVPLLARHRTTLCPAKLIICRFCHLLVPQQAPPYDAKNPTLEVEESLLLNSGLTPHESDDGSRTADCPSCGRPVRLRELESHLRHHTLENATRATPAICRNGLCGRTLGGVNPTGGPPKSIASNGEVESRMGLCGVCYAPLYAPVYDPTGKAMRRRVERRYLTQLTKGCGKDWCHGPYCKTGRTHLGEPAVGIRDATALVKPVVDVVGSKDGAFFFCVDEDSQRRRELAVAMSADENGYEAGWWVVALETCGANLERARAWLEKWAPSREARQA